MKRFVFDLIRSTIGSRKARAVAAALLVDWVVVRFGIDLDAETKQVLIGSVTVLAGIFIWGTATEDAATKEANGGRLPPPPPMP